MNRGVRVIAVVAAPPPRRLGRLRTIACGDLHVVVADAAAPPRLDLRALRAHDAAVRRAAAGASAALPVRFGTFVDEERLEPLIASRADALRAALALVRDRVQLTLRWFDDAVEAPPPPPADTGAGTSYLLARARSRALPQLDPVRARVATLIRAERVEPASPGAAPLIATIHHLVDERDVVRYLAATRVAARRCAPARLLVSGPSLPWAFAGEEVA